VNYYEDAKAKESGTWIRGSTTDYRNNECWFWSNSTSYVMHNSWTGNVDCY